MWSDIKTIKSSDQNVLKYVFEREDAVAESVLYKYPTYEERTVICCSTQSGCRVGCRFCGAGDYFVRSLTAEEIASQPDYLLSETKVEPNKIDRLQIMFMSMGEPLMNFKNLAEAIRYLYAKYPNAALLISTIGPSIKYQQVINLSVEIPTIGLQFSIHESTDEKRNKLIPFKKKLSLAEISEVGNQWYRSTGRKPFFNYCAHEQNSTQEDANRLIRLFPADTWNATISVICERTEHVSAANERQRGLAEKFEQILQREGYNTRTFNPAGQDDIGGGCGQLWFVQDWMRLNSHLARPSCGNGLPVIHTPTT